VGQVVELQPHAVLEIFFEHHSANSFGHGILLLSRALALVGTYVTSIFAAA
jgi:hypothetical protein